MPHRLPRPTPRASLTDYGAECFRPHPARAAQARPLIVARLAGNARCQPEQDRERDLVPGRVALRHDHIDARAGLSQVIEIDLTQSLFALFIRDRLHHGHRVRRAQRVELRAQPDIDSALSLLAVGFLEDSPLDAGFGFRRAQHLMVDLVEAARGDVFCDVSGRGVFRDLRQVQQQGSHQRGLGLRPERVAVVVLIEIESHDDGCDLLSQFGVPLHAGTKFHRSDSRGSARSRR